MYRYDRGHTIYGYGVAGTSGPTLRRSQIGPRLEIDLCNHKWSLIQEGNWLTQGEKVWRLRIGHLRYNLFV